LLAVQEGSQPRRALAERLRCDGAGPQLGKPASEVRRQSENQRDRIMGKRSQEARHFEHEERSPG
jgi:hypothetical protein